MVSYLIKQPWVIMTILTFPDCSCPSQHGQALCPCHTQNCLRTLVVVVGEPGLYHYPCYQEREVEAEAGSDLPGRRAGSHSWVPVTAETTFYPALASLGLQSQVHSPELGCSEAPAYHRDCQDAGPVPTQHTDQEWLSCVLLGPESDGRHVSQYSLAVEPVPVCGVCVQTWESGGKQSSVCCVHQSPLFGRGMQWPPCAYSHPRLSKRERHMSALLILTLAWVRAMGKRQYLECFVQDIGKAAQSHVLGAEAEASQVTKGSSVDQSGEGCWAGEA